MLTPSYAGITYPRLETSHGLQWPCPNEEHPGTAYLHRDRFSKGKGTFLPCDFRPLAEPPDEEYDFLLTTGRIYFHYHTGTMTRRISALAREAPEATGRDPSRGRETSGHPEQRHGRDRFATGFRKGQGGSDDTRAEESRLFHVPLPRIPDQRPDQPGIGSGGQNSRIQGMRRKSEEMRMKKLAKSELKRLTETGGPEEYRVLAPSLEGEWRLPASTPSMRIPLPSITENPAPARSLSAFPRAR